MHAGAVLKFEQMHRRRRPIIPAALVAVASLSLPAAGCGGGGSPRVADIASPTTNAHGSSSSNSSPAAARGTKALAYSHCMRSNGVPNYPDPNTTDNLPKGSAQAFGVSTSQYQAAAQACRQTCYPAALAPR